MNLKNLYKALLTGLPMLAYNPINQNILHAPFYVNKYSTYINYKLNKNQLVYINKYLESRNFKSIPVSIIDNEDKNYYISINIYNCTSPLFSFINKEPITRCEINTYVINNNLKGTLIMDYISNFLSMDSDNIFKFPENTKFIYNKNKNKINSLAKNNNIDFKLDFKLQDNLNNNFNKKLSNNLIENTDYIFYNNGIYDKVFYDSTLINNNLIMIDNFNVYFKFLNIEFNNPESVFYFEDKINFVGGMWYNIFSN